MKLNIYFEDLREETKEEITQELKEENKEEIDKLAKDNPRMSREDVEREFIDDYINTHNFAQEISY